MRSLRPIAALILVLVACEPAPEPRAPSEAVPSPTSAGSPEADLSFPGGGRILFVPNVGSYTGHFGIVDADGSTTYLGDDRFSFPYWDPSDPTRLLTIPFDDAPRRAPSVRAFVVAGDELRPAGSWRGSPSFTFLSLDGAAIASTPFDPSGRLRTGVVRVVDRATGETTSLKSGTLVPVGWTPADELIASPWSGGSIVRWDPRTGAMSRFGPPDIWGVVWDPTGHRFAGGVARGGRDARGAIAIGDAEGEVDDRVPLGRSQASVPTWSPDGRRIAFILGGQGRMASERSSLHVYDVASGVDSVVAHPISHAFWASWSPDGRWLLLDDWTRERWLFVAADGSERIPYPRLGHFPRWCCPSSPPSSTSIPVS